MKDKSIKSTMKSWIMLSDKELDDTQVYMKEQEGENTEVFIMTRMLEEIPIYILIMTDCIRTVMKRRQSQT